MRAAVVVMLVGLVGLVGLVAIASARGGAPKPSAPQPSCAELAKRESAVKQREDALARREAAVKKLEADASTCEQRRQDELDRQKAEDAKLRRQLK